LLNESFDWVTGNKKTILLQNFRSSFYFLRKNSKNSQEKVETSGNTRLLCCLLFPNVLGKG
jgi:hypothetical protein